MREITKNTYKKNTFLFDKKIYKNIIIVQIKRTSDHLKNDYTYYVSYKGKYYKTDNENEIYNLLNQVEC